MPSLYRSLKQIAVPLGIILILSSCFILGWYMYRTVYLPLFSAEAAAISASDYAVPTAKLNSTVEAIEARSSSNVDFSPVPNRFAPESTASR